jgi:hypothetical protein
VVHPPPLPSEDRGGGHLTSLMGTPLPPPESPGVNAPSPSSLHRLMAAVLGINALAMWRVHVHASKFPTPTPDPPLHVHARPATPRAAGIVSSGICEL